MGPCFLALKDTSFLGFLRPTTALLAFLATIIAMIISAEVVWTGRWEFGLLSRDFSVGGLLWIPVFDKRVDFILHMNEK